jgi:hypothetical protein
MSINIENTKKRFSATALLTLWAWSIAVLAALMLGAAIYLLLEVVTA